MTAPVAPPRSFEAIVIGGSAGALAVLKAIVHAITAPLTMPLLVVLHVRDDRKSLLREVLSNGAAVPVVEVEDKQPLAAGHVYVAPPGYHLLVEDKGSLALSVERPEHFSRPSIDVLFDSAVRVFGASVLGVVLSGASADGALGLQAIMAAGGAGIVQAPESAAHRAMPEAALLACPHAAALAPPELERTIARVARGEMLALGGRHG